MYKLKFNTDLNVLVDTINKILTSAGGKAFDKKDMTISLCAKELDKFGKSHKMNENFAVNINYSLLFNNNKN
jgi:hypothetical protein